MSEYSYYVLDDETEEDARPTGHPANGPGLLVEDCARDWHNQHGGWEGSWPVTIVFLRDGIEQSRWNVEREFVPEFRAEMIQIGTGKNP